MRNVSNNYLIQMDPHTNASQKLWLCVCMIAEMRI